jgi:hypothetical protein
MTVIIIDVEDALLRDYQVDVQALVVLTGWGCGLLGRLQVDTERGLFDQDGDLAILGNGRSR